MHPHLFYFSSTTVPSKNISLDHVCMFLKCGNRGNLCLKCLVSKEFVGSRGPGTGGNFGNRTRSSAHAFIALHVPQKRRQMLIGASLAL